jgi:heme exporter protein B
MTPLTSTASTDEGQASAPKERPLSRLSAVRLVLTIASKDLRSELRSKDTLNASLSFAVVILLLFSFAFDMTPEQVREMGGGLLWLVFMFAGALILNRSFSRELPNDCLEALLASPITGAQLWAGKALANYILVLAVEAVCLPVFSIFYDVNLLPRFSGLVVVLLLGTWALTVIGTVFSAMTVNLRLRELMLPTLLYPMLIPVLLAAIQLTGAILSPDSTADNTVWYRLLVAYDVIFTLLAAALVEILLIG